MLKLHFNPFTVTISYLRCGTKPNYGYADPTQLSFAPIFMINAHSAESNVRFIFPIFFSYSWFCSQFWNVFTIMPLKFYNLHERLIFRFLRFLVFELCSILCSKIIDKLTNFEDKNDHISKTEYHKNRKIDFSFVSTHFTSFM